MPLKLYLGQSQSQSATLERSINTTNRMCIGNLITSFSGINNRTKPVATVDKAQSFYEIHSIQEERSPMKKTPAINSASYIGIKTIDEKNKIYKDQKLHHILTKD